MNKTILTIFFTFTLLATTGCTKTISKQVACEKDTDCKNSCQYGAVNKTWYESEQKNITECSDGCASVVSAEPKCENKVCVAYMQDPSSGKLFKNDDCTNKKILNSNPTNKPALSTKFQMEISMTKKQTQTEGSGNTIEMKIDGKKVTGTTYYWNPGGTNSQDFNYELSDSALADLLSIINKNKINTNLEEIKPLEKTGYAITMNTKINIDGILTNANIEGMYDWTVGSKNNPEIKNLNYFLVVEQIVKNITENKK